MIVVRRAGRAQILVFTRVSIYTERAFAAQVARFESEGTRRYRKNPVSLAGWIIENIGSVSQRSHVERGEAPAYSRHLPCAPP
jgi:hypothetical protein